MRATISRDVAGAPAVEAEHVNQALNQRIERSGRIPAKVREMIAEGALRVSLTGRSVGQVNGLSVVDLGEVRFGWPWRITAATGIGQEGIVNIERESELAGSTYNKGVLILEGYLRNRYAREHPLSLSASLAFEQSYGWIDGDSASSAELYCLLSSLAGVPIRQDIAVTGSVNQHGEVQVIGGVNEKVEGFFDVCRIKGLTGTQGVCIPRGNIPNLMLRRDVIEAVGQGRVPHLGGGLDRRGAGTPDRRTRWQPGRRGNDSPPGRPATARAPVQIAGAVGGRPRSPAPGSSSPARLLLHHRRCQGKARNSEHAPGLWLPELDQCDKARALME